LSLSGAVSDAPETCPVSRGSARDLRLLGLFHSAFDGAPLEFRYLTNQIRDLEPRLSARRSTGHPLNGVEIESKLEFNVWRIELNEEYVPNTRKGQ
jgi:hypothetical protein